MNKSQFLQSSAAQALASYHSRHRHADRPPLEVGDVVHLFPEQSLTIDNEGISPWTSPWPHGSRAGVYLIYSADAELLYIGKASMGKHIGHRLYHHFGGGVRCVFNINSWPISPQFVVNIAVPHDAPFEAPALEEFLIAALSPKLNVCGLRTSDMVPSPLPPQVVVA